MPIEAAWIREPAIRCHTYQGKITAKELEDFIAGELTLLKTLNRKIYYVSDFNKVESFPLNLMQLPAALELVRNPNFGAVAFTGIPSVMNFWATVFNKVSNFKLIKADSVVHAQEQLEKIYGTSANVQPENQLLPPLA